MIDAFFACYGVIFIVSRHWKTSEGAVREHAVIRGVASHTLAFDIAIIAVYGTG